MAEKEVKIPEAFGDTYRPTGGGYAQYGGTGAAFTGFQNKTFVNDETGQRIVVFFFNGRPLSRIPAGFRAMGDTPVEEQQESQKVIETANEDTSNFYDGISDEIKESEINWRNKNPSDWSNDEYNSYYKDLKSTIDKGQDPLGLSTAEEMVTTLLGGPVGVLGKVMGADTGLSTLIKKSKKNQAQKVFDSIANMETATNTQRDTQYLLGGALGVEGYAKPYTSDEIDEFGMPTEQALKDRGSSGTGILDMSKIKGTVTDEGVFVGDVEDYYEAGGVRPRARPEPVPEPESKGKYDPTKASSAGGATTNTLNEREQVAFDALVDSGDDAGVNHYVAINRLRNKQNAYAEGNMTREEGAAMGLSQHDMDQADKYGGSVATAIEEGRAANQGIFKEARVIKDNDPPKGSGEGDKDDGGCVIATHGISTGGFSALDKAKAELWCERTYHGKWYGEAFRRGYRYAGNKAIDKGKAAEHYQEFKDFVSYGRGLKKGLKPAINYYLRTTQFFLTGLFVK